VSTETLALLASLFFVLFCNGAFWSSALAGRSASDPATWLFCASVFAVLVALHFVALALISLRSTVKPLLIVLFFATAAATYFMGKYSVFLDPTMLRNLIHTDPGEARDLLAWDMLPHLALQAALPAWLVWRCRVTQRRFGAAVGWRIGAIVGAFLVGAAAFLSVSQDLSSLMRSQKSMRYLVTPANYVYSLTRVATADAVTAAKPLVPIGLDAVASPAAALRSKPTLFVLMVGETARAANWGLNGYARQTTPELAALDVVNFSDVGSCGTNTETSVPCMFARIGRLRYDEDRIRSEESLLHVLNRAGVQVQWRDNQSGCKGVCAGLPTQKMEAKDSPALCQDGECMDEILLAGLAAHVAAKPSAPTQARANQAIVMHLMGSHGPAYYRRAPAAFQRFKPTCETSELRKCSVQEVVNSYDNSIVYTDHVVAQTIAFLKSQSARFDTALLYVSDHGESLGENNLFLHGLPYAIAPKQQTHVPMVLWLSDGYAASRRVDATCLRARAAKPAAHDHLFSTVLAILDVQTSVYDPALDLLRECRAAAP
jgi:lipid A ethanolaminephosphotransferase